MSKQKSFVNNLLSFMIYKKPEKVKEFYIPESVDENSENPSKLNDDKSKAAKKTDEISKGLKKPVLVSEMEKEKVQNRDKADDNKISMNFKTNISYLEQKFNAKINKDIIIREFLIVKKYKAFIVYIEGMVDRVTVNNSILKPLLKDISSEDIKETCKLDYILESIIETNNAKKITDHREAVSEILSGNTCLYIDSCNFYLSCETKGYEKRSVEKPQIEGVVKGAQEAFTENLRTNITLIRKIIANSDLTTEFLRVGERNKSHFAIMYLNGLVNPAIVKEVKRRINGIKTDFLAGEGMLEQFIEDHPLSIVPTVLSTERPDRAASHIVEGKVAIISNGSPFAAIVPVTLASLFHTPEDASLRWQYGTLVRFIRLFAVFVSTFLPGMYVALTNFHNEMIPTELLIAIAIARENVPFPTIVEVLLMELSFELIREAGIRIPGIIGNTIGIIGALILGQAAVQANLVSPVLIIIIAFTGLGNFAFADFSLAYGARLSRLAFVFAGAVLGFYGISLLLVALSVLILDMKSFGVPYVSMLSPKTRKSFDFFIRWPIWKQELRPDNVNPLDIRRQPEISRQWTRQDPESSYEREGENE